MYCPNCGKTVPEGAVFCEYCGAVISGKNANASPKLTSEVIEQQSFDMSAMDMDSRKRQMSVEKEPALGRLRV